MSNNACIPTTRRARLTARDGLTLDAEAGALGGVSTPTDSVLSAAIPTQATLTQLRTLQEKLLYFG